MAAPGPTLRQMHSPRRTLFVLHPALALTGILHSIGGPLLPSLAKTFDLTDSQSGLLLSAYYAGTSLGALLCGRNHARSVTAGFLGLVCVCLLIAATRRAFLDPLFLILGICVGIPMTAICMMAGRMFGAHSAAPLTFLNFSWSAGALVAPLFAAQALISHSFRVVYVILAGACAVAALACWLQLEDPLQPEPHPPTVDGMRSVRLIVLFACLTFLEVGIENTAGSWLTTYVLRSSGTGVSFAAASASLYWMGFLASRGLSSLLLLRVEPMRLLRLAVVLGFVAAVLLISLPGTVNHALAMVLLGAALAPIFPLLLAQFFALAYRPSDSRWVLAFCGFGGSVVPWLTGWISAQSGSLRVALTTIPAALLLIDCILLVMGTGRSAASAK